MCPAIPGFRGRVWYRGHERGRLRTKPHARREAVVALSGWHRRNCIYSHYAPKAYLWIEVRAYCAVLGEDFQPIGLVVKTDAQFVCPEETPGDLVCAAPALTTESREETSRVSAAAASL